MSPGFSSLNLVLLGPPGSGRSTQAALLAERYRIPHISTGDMLRDEINKGTTRGLEVEEALNKGELVNNTVVTGLVLQRLDAEDCTRGFVLEGFPRSAEQAAVLDGVLAELGRGIERVFLLELSDDEIVRRHDNRQVRREDDREEAVRERLRVYHAEGPALIDYYRKRGQLVPVNGSRGVDEVSDVIRQAIETPVGV